MSEFSDAKRVRAAKRIVGVAVGLAVIVGGLYLARTIRNNMSFARTALMQERLGQLGAGMGKYFEDTGSYLGFLMTDQGPELDVSDEQANSLFMYRANIHPLEAVDLFAPTEGAYVRFWHDGNFWTLWSAGPDRKYDLIDEKDYGQTDPTELNDMIARYLYDPSNGAFSEGDIFIIFR